MHDVSVVRLEEIDAESAQLLPRRETLCQFACTDVANVVGVNIALAINAATIESSASSAAEQYLSGAQS